MIVSHLYKLDQVNSAIEGLNKLIQQEFEASEWDQYFILKHMFFSLQGFYIVIFIIYIFY